MVAVSEPHHTTSVVSQSITTCWLALEKAQGNRATGGAVGTQGSTCGSGGTHHVSYGGHNCNAQVPVCELTVRNSPHYSTVQ